MWIARVWMDQVIGEWREDHYPIVEVWTVAVESERGERWLYIGRKLNRDTAGTLTDRINRHTTDNPGWHPTPELWDEIYPVYGSEYYQSSNAESAWAAEEKAADAFGPDPRMLHLS